MKLKKNVIKAIIALCVILACFSCQKEESGDGIIGKWKLVRIVTLGYWGSFSEYNIVYEFKANGICTISGSPEEENMPKNGSCSYSIIETEDDFFTTGNGNLLFDDDSYSAWYSIDSKSNELAIFFPPYMESIVYSFIKIK